MIGLFLAPAGCRLALETLPSGGNLLLSRQSMQQPGGLQQTLVGQAEFYRPPGPPEPLGGPLPGACVLLTPTPVPSGTPPVDWLDAGPHLTLATSTRSLVYDRFAGGGGSIEYLPTTGTSPGSVLAEDSFDLTVPGASGANGLAGATLPGALAIPEAVGLTAPDFTTFPVHASGLFSLSWAAGAPGRYLEIDLAIYATAGLVTLACSAPDSGSFSLSSALTGTLAPGPGLLTVSRSVERVTELPDQTGLTARGEWVEGGAVVLP